MRPARIKCANVSASGHIWFGITVTRISLPLSCLLYSSHQNQTLNVSIRRRHVKTSGPKKISIASKPINRDRGATLILGKGEGGGLISDSILGGGLKTLFLTCPPPPPPLCPKQMELRIIIPNSMVVYYFDFQGMSFYSSFSRIQCSGLR